MKTITALLLGLFLSTTVFAADLSLSPQQKAQLKHAAPNIRITPQFVKLMTDLVYSPAMPIDERLKAVAHLSGVDQLPPGDRMNRKICIWDIAGRSGPVFSAAQEQKTKAMQLGVDLNLIPYTDENVMVDAFKAGRCDAALMTGLRARSFNKFTGTVDAIGALPTTQDMHTLVRVLADPRSAKHMTHGQYTVLGVFPGGGAYVFVDDKHIDSLSKAAGRKVAVLDYDPVQAKMIAAMGATPVPTDIARAPSMFNDGVVDILAAPLVAYNVMELYKGMSPNGGIINYPLAQISMQLIGRRDKFPPQVAQLIREASAARFDQVIDYIHKITGKVPAHWWIHISEKDKIQYESMMQDARISLRKQGYYDADMLTLERKIRCKFDPSRSECANPVE